MAEIDSTHQEFQQNVDFAKWRARFILKISSILLAVFWTANLYITWMLASHQVEPYLAQAFVYQIAITTTCTEIFAVFYTWSQGAELRPYIDQLGETVRWSQLIFRFLRPAYEAMDELGRKITGRAILEPGERVEFDRIIAENAKLKKENESLKSQMFRRRFLQRERKGKK